MEKLIPPKVIEELMAKTGSQPVILYRLCLVYAAMDQLGIDSASV